MSGLLPDKLPVAKKKVLVPDKSLDALARNSLKRIGFLQPQAPGPGLLDNCLRQGMF